jgi:long-chain acyl-CoA synthetase
MRADTIPARFLSQAKVRPHAPAYYVRLDGQWQMITWRRRAERVQRIARSLMALGVPAGGATAILGSNRAEWVDWHVATMMIGATPAGIYTTCSAEQVRYIVEHSDAFCLSTARISCARRSAGMPRLAHVVLMPCAPGCVLPLKRFSIAPTRSITRSSSKEWPLSAKRRRPP